MVKIKINSRLIYGIVVLVAIAVATNLLIFAFNSSISGQSALIMIGATIMLEASLALYLSYADKDNFMSPRKMGALGAMSILSLAFILICDNLLGVVGIAPLALCALSVALLVSTHGGFASNLYVVMIYFVQYFVCDSSRNMVDIDSFYVLFAGVLVTIYSVFVMGKQYMRLVYIKFGLGLGIISAVSRVVAINIFSTDVAWGAVGIEATWAFGSGVVSVMLMLVLLPVVERVFNVVSPFRFAEIATCSNPLMQEMYEVAPGTYNHSLTVANYVEACAEAIGESTFLARSVAYYHDIGKMNNAKYFAENIPAGQANPHETLTPEASIDIITSHVTYGLALAKQRKLPVEVQRAIIEHHGTMPIKFFYHKAARYTDGVLPYDDYSYDGPKPSSKISAILMICDACEAALRAESDKTQAESIVDNIVAERMAFDQFSQCDITMREIDIIKSTIITTHGGIKHDRVKYPDIVLGE